MITYKAVQYSTTEHSSWQYFAMSRHMCICQYANLLWAQYSKLFIHVTSTPEGKIDSLHTFGNTC